MFKRKHVSNSKILNLLHSILMFQNYFNEAYFGFLNVHIISIMKALSRFEFKHHSMISERWRIIKRVKLTPYLIRNEYFHWKKKPCCLTINTSKCRAFLGILHCEQIRASIYPCNTKIHWYKKFLLAKRCNETVCFNCIY